ncbi:MAG: tRNA1(Val) (adenine(37)-N6)-methyltransferase [Ferruginibacter sp.]
MNSWFQFKQFTIQQDMCAMKVCTDACLFGAWVSNKFEQTLSPNSVLDIGCGTGLLSLMLAQKTDTPIDAVEIDEMAYKQAKKNVELSPWQEQISVHHTAIINFIPTYKYDLIICNPPFYENQLKSVDVARNLAMHATSLSFASLSSILKQQLCHLGVAALLLPSSVVKNMEEHLNKESLFIIEKTDISHSPSHSFFRSFLLVSHKKYMCRGESIAIKNSNNQYSDEFVKLLKDYYLHL